MRRAVLTLGSTVAGLAALFSFKTHTPGTTPAAAPSAAPAGLSMAATAPPMTTANGSSTVPSAATATTPAKKPAPAKTTPSATVSATQSYLPVVPMHSATPTPTHTTAPPRPSGSFTGPAEDTQYGPVQVQITVAGGKITKSEGALPQGGDSIAQNALPQLNQEVLTAQSADIQAVSGATYTSDGYISSLQKAVDQAGL